MDLVIYLSRQEYNDLLSCLDPEDRFIALGDFENVTRKGDLYIKTLDRIVFRKRNLVEEAV